MGTFSVRLVYDVQQSPVLFIVVFGVVAVAVVVVIVFVFIVILIVVYRMRYARTKRNDKNLFVEHVFCHWLSFVC